MLYKQIVIRKTNNVLSDITADIQIGALSNKILKFEFVCSHLSLFLNIYSPFNVYCCEGVK